MPCNVVPVMPFNPFCGVAREFAGVVQALLAKIEAVRPRADTESQMLETRLSEPI